MFAAFERFANGIISHEASNQGGGGGHAFYSPTARPQEGEEEKEAELHLASDSLKLSNSRPLRISILK